MALGLLTREKEAESRVAGKRGLCVDLDLPVLTGVTLGLHTREKEAEPRVREREVCVSISVCPYDRRDARAPHSAPH